MEGTRSSTLYKLSIDPVPPQTEQHESSTVLIVTNKSDADLTLWHNRMGHVNIHVLK